MRLRMGFHKRQPSQLPRMQNKTKQTTKMITQANCRKINYELNGFIWEERIVTLPTGEILIYVKEKMGKA